MKFLIIGCGYFGSHVASYWRNQGHQVFVTTRSRDRFGEFERRGLLPVAVDVTQPSTLESLPQANVVLFSVGFDRQSDHDIRQVYVDGLENVLERIPDSVEHFVYTSSTGVLSDSDGRWIDESAPTSPTRLGAKAHLEAEQILQDSDWQSRSTILRLAGIYGVNRIPRLQAVKNRDWHLLPRKGHVNLIHVQDAAGIAGKVVELQLKDQLYHVSDGHPPLRKLLYEFVAAELGAGEIDWSGKADAMVAIRSSSDKRISNNKLVADTQYPFFYPDFMAGIRAALKSMDS